MNKKSKEEKKLITYGKYVEGIKKIKLYEDQQTRFRSLALTTLVYYLLTLSYIFSPQSALHIQQYQMHISASLSVVAIALIYLLVLQDLVALERFKISFFGNCFNIEKRSHFLPSLFHYMMEEEAYKHHSSPARKLTYYIALIIGPFVGVGTSLGYLLEKLGYTPHLGWTLTFAALFTLLSSMFLKVGRFRVLISKVIKDKNLKTASTKPTPIEKSFIISSFIAGTGLSVLSGLLAVSPDKHLLSQVVIFCFLAANMVSMTIHSKRLWKVQELDAVEKFTQFQGIRKNG